MQKEHREETTQTCGGSQATGSGPLLKQAALGLSASSHQWEWGVWGVWGVRRTTHLTLSSSCVLLLFPDH